MSELQTRMSIGQKQHSDDSAEGNRTVTYDQAGKKWTVTFVEQQSHHHQVPLRCTFSRRWQNPIG